MKTRRVVVTGAGAVTPFGDLAQTAEAIREKRSALAPVSRFDASPFGEERGGECRSFDPRPWFRQPKSLKVADRRTRLAVAAARMAAVAARIDDRPLASAGVVIGTSASDLQTEECALAVGNGGDVRDIDGFGGRILSKLNPLWLLVNLANMASAHVAIELEARGPNSTITTDWIAGVQAMGEAARWIEDGEADLVIAGGADCGVLPFVYAALEDAGYLGGGEPPFVPAEGAAVFVVEEREHARARRAPVLAEVTGYASAAGAQALRQTMDDALQQSGKRDVDLLCRAAIFVPEHWRAEDDAIDSVFARPPREFECNSMLGNGLAAASPIALAVALGMCRDEERLLLNAVGATGEAASIALTTGGRE